MTPRTAATTLQRLRRRQLDARLAAHPRLAPPRDGWIRVVREALGMTLAQLGHRLGITPQSVQDLEAREREGRITLERLREAADALGCDVAVTLVPRTSLEAIVRTQARARIAAERERVAHTMRLEGQEGGLEDGEPDEYDIVRYIDANARTLWRDS
jgi:predicted DNA-binding mobile mystery protein A